MSKKFKNNIEEESNDFKKDIADDVFINDVKVSCDDIEERVYALNNVIREKGTNDGTISSDKIIIILDSLVQTVKKIKESVTQENAYNARNELINVQREIDALFDKAVKTR